MTIETWMAEAGLPITQKPATELEAARMSLRKWEALELAVLARHECRMVEDGEVLGRGKGMYVMNMNTCALCRYHVYHPNAPEFGAECGNCILSHVGEECDTVPGNPYNEAYQHGRIGPMLAQLRLAVKTLEEEQ